MESIAIVYQDLWTTMTAKKGMQLRAEMIEDVVQRYEEVSVKLFPIIIKDCKPELQPRTYYQQQALDLCEKMLRRKSDPNMVKDFIAVCAEIVANISCKPKEYPKDRIKLVLKTILKVAKREKQTADWSELGINTISELGGAKNLVNEINKVLQ
jgi:hypothetical protein